MHVVPHHSMAQLQHLQNHADRPARVLKLRAVILARQGWIASRIADALGKGTRTIQQWIGDYNRAGLEGLRDHRTSHHRYLTAQQEDPLRRHLDEQANDPHAGVRYAAQLNGYIERHFNNMAYSLSGLYELLHRLGYSWLMPRPCHEKNDPRVVEAFKKRLQRSSHRLPQSIPTNASKCGSRMRRGSANKAH